jgi:hypothetical protein
MNEVMVEPIRVAIESLAARADGGAELAHVAAELRAPTAAAGARDLAPALVAALASPELARLAAAFGASVAQQAVVAAVVAPELDARIARAYAALNAPRHQPRATVALLDDLLAALGLGAGAAAEALRDPAWQSWGLVELDPGAARQWQAVVAPPDVRAWFDGAAPPAPLAVAEVEMTARTRARVARAVECARAAETRVVIAGARGSGRRAVAAAVLAAAGWPATAIAASAEVAVALRSAAWHRHGLVVGPDVPPAMITELARRCPTPIAVVTERAAIALSALDAARAGRAAAPPTRVAEVEVEPLGIAERLAVWDRVLPEERRRGLDLATLVPLTREPERIAAAARLALDRTAADVAVDREAIAAAWQSLSTASFGELAHDVETDARADDLVVPAATRRELELLIAWATHRDQVLAALPRGALFTRGLACLFHGSPGTGKTLAARVVAARLGRRLVRIDLSQVLDKYLGETEKQLDRVFTVAEADEVILFFDEADALFARRTEVHDARDRYANVETGFLLQRIETHPGVSILATNLPAGLDPAFSRRLHVIAEFHLPEVAERGEIWRRHLPAERADDVDVAMLAEFALAGGDIRNVSFTAMVLAAAAGRPLAMADLIVALCRFLRARGTLIDAGAFGAWAGVAVGWLQPGGAVTR